MNLKQKLIYMALGCLFTLIGYTLATLNTNVTADEVNKFAHYNAGGKIVDEIICHKLKVVDARGNTVLLLNGSMPTTDDPWSGCL
jgi:hypothetical protein